MDKHRPADSRKIAEALLKKLGRPEAELRKEETRKKLKVLVGGKK